jgi:hypothetical protein
MRALFATADARELQAREYHAVEGGNQTLDRLGAYLASREASRVAGRGVTES